MSRPTFMSFVNVTVQQNASVSDAFDVGDKKIVGVICPSAIEATTAQLSITGAASLAGTYKTVKPDGVKFVVPFAVDDYITFKTITSLYGVRFAKLVMETAGGVAVVQATAPRVFIVILDAA